MKRIKAEILSETTQEDGSIMIEIKKQYNTSPVGHYNVIAERGHEYYVENKVRYISIDGTKGYAVRLWTSWSFLSAKSKSYRYLSYAKLTTKCHLTYDK